MSIKEQATQSVFWSAIERFSVQGIQFLLTIIIARLLLPSDYGLIAMLGIFMAIAQTFIDGGFANALIQKKNRTETDCSTVFYFNIIVSAILYLLLCLAAPAIASFYEKEQLAQITRVVGLTLIINSFGIVQQAKLTIALNFKRLAAISLLSVIISGIIGIWMAYSNYGVWTLVYQSLLNNLLRVIFVWISSKWMPLCQFSLNSFRTLFAFGSKLLLSSLLHTIYTKLYTLIIGKVFSANDLGNYDRASTIAMFPSTNLTNVIVRAIYPIQCRLQDDTLQLKTIFLKYMRMACYIIFPLMIGLSALSEPLVRWILTDKWLEAVPFLQILCIAYMWDPVMKINHNILNVKGRSNYFLYAELIKKATAFIILFTTIPFGVKIMCWGLVLYSFADIIIIIYYSKKLINIGYRNQLIELLPIIILSFSMGSIVYGTILLLHHTAFFLQILIGTLAGIIYYFSISKILHFKELDFLLSFIKKKR